MDYFNEFKNNLSRTNKKLFEKKDKNKPGYFHTNFDRKTYPTNKRFIIFVDRRLRDDKITFTEPPYVFDTIPPNHVPAWGYESIHACIIPRKGFGDGMSWPSVDEKKSKPHEETICVKLHHVSKKNSNISLH